MEWNPSEHPRKAAGAAGGGQFAPLSYNAKTNTGTGYGKKHGDDRVRDAQKALNALGMKDASGKPLVLDGKLGPRTTAALKRYQKAHGMRPDGKITPALLSRLKSRGGSKGKTLHRAGSSAGRSSPAGHSSRRSSGGGSRGGSGQIGAARRALLAAGLVKGNPSDKQVTAAVKKYQKSRHMPANGKITPELLDRLRKDRAHPKAAVRTRITRPDIRSIEAAPLTKAMFARRRPLPRRRTA